ncbi:hypothetical protein ACT3TB_16440 [Micrococcaceae sp. AOP34-BR2-30]
MDTFKDAAVWVAEDLQARGAGQDDWDERITYRLASGGAVEVTLMTRSWLAIMPVAYNTNGVMVATHQLAEHAETTKRIRIALMRAARKSRAA